MAQIQPPVRFQIPIPIRFLFLFQTGIGIRILGFRAGSGTVTRSRARFRLGFGFGSMRRAPCPQGNAHSWTFITKTETLAQWQKINGPALVRVSPALNPSPIPTQPRPLWVTVFLSLFVCLCGFYLVACFIPTSNKKNKCKKHKKRKRNLWWWKMETAYTFPFFRPHAAAAAFSLDF